MSVAQPGAGEEPRTAPPRDGGSDGGQHQPPLGHPHLELWALERPEVARQVGDKFRSASPESFACPEEEVAPKPEEEVAPKPGRAWRLLWEGTKRRV